MEKAHPNEQARLIELPESADQQRQQLIQNAQSRSDAYTVIATDVVWTAEFAANGWEPGAGSGTFSFQRTGFVASCLEMSIASEGDTGDEAGTFLDGRYGVAAVTGQVPCGRTWMLQTCV